MTARVERGSVPEQRPTEPKISITIAFSAHVTQEDAGWIAPLLKEADVFIPEVPGWSEKHLKDYQRVSSGLLTLEQLVAHVKGGLEPFVLEHLRMLSGSRKPVLFIDIPEGHPILQREEVSTLRPNKDHRTESLPDLKPYEQFEELLAVLVRVSGRIGLAMAREREEYMLSQLKPAVVKLWKQHPRLGRQSELKVLLHLGSAHTPICAFLRRAGVMAVSKFDRLPVVYSYQQEIHRRATFNREIDKDLVARAFLELESREAFGLVRNITTDYWKATITTRLVLSQFSFEDAREIFEGMKQGQNFEDLFADKLKEKGITLPATEGELDTLLESRGIKFRPSP